MCGYLMLVCNALMYIGYFLFFKMAICPMWLKAPLDTMLLVVSSGLSLWNPVVMLRSEVLRNRPLHVRKKTDDKYCKMGWFPAKVVLVGVGK